MASQSITDPFAGKKNTKNNIPPPLPPSNPTHNTQQSLKKTESNERLPSNRQTEPAGPATSGVMSDRPYDLGFSIW